MPAQKFLLSFFLLVFLSLFITAQNLKLEEVISKHKSSIGSPEKQKELKNMVLLGSSAFESKLPERKSYGKIAIISEPSKLLFIASFESESYPYEKIGIFDGEIHIPFVLSGLRSPLGDFLWEHPSILKHGLFSGSMSLKWRLLDDKSKTGKMILDGTKKIDGRKAYVIEYFTGGTSDNTKFRLFFDAENFRHIRSEYREVYLGKDQPFGTLGRANDYVLQLTETFSDFTTHDGITIPGVTKIHYMGSSSKGTYEYDWTFKINEVKFNQPLKEGFFKLD